MLYVVSRRYFLLFTITMSSLFFYASSCDKVQATAASTPKEIPAESKQNISLAANGTVPKPAKEQVIDPRALSKTFTEIASQVSPSVVTIRVEGPKISANRLPFRSFPFPFGMQDDDGRLQQKRPSFQGAGSGFVVDERGFIATNRHVIQNAATIEVVFADGKKFKAKLVSTDPRLDVAVVKILDLGTYPLKAATLGDSEKLKAGEFVMAIGNPFGFDHTVTVGVISATGRKIGQLPDYQDLLQTDASINQGNSGGPLINLDGEVIGINTMIVAPSGGNVGIGFAIPSNMAKKSISEMIAFGKVARAYIGVSVRALTDQEKDFLEQVLGIQNQGVLVERVSPKSPSEKAGLKAQDVLLSMDGQPVKDFVDVVKLVSAHKIGEEITLELLRKGKKTKIQVKTDSFPIETKDDHSQESNEFMFEGQK